MSCIPYDEFISIIAENDDNIFSEDDKDLISEQANWQGCLSIEQANGVDADAHKLAVANAELATRNTLDLNAVKTVKVAVSLQQKTTYEAVPHLYRLGAVTFLGDSHLAGYPSRATTSSGILNSATLLVGLGSRGVSSTLLAGSSSLVGLLGRLEFAGRIESIAGSQLDPHGVRGLFSLLDLSTVGLSSFSGNRHSTGDYSDGLKSEADLAGLLTRSSSAILDSATLMTGFGYRQLVSATRLDSLSGLRTFSGFMHGGSLFIGSASSLIGQGKLAIPGLVEFSSNGSVYLDAARLLSGTASINSPMGIDAAGRVARSGNLSLGLLSSFSGKGGLTFPGLLVVLSEAGSQVNASRILSGVAPIDQYTALDPRGQRRLQSEINLFKKSSVNTAAFKSVLNRVIVQLESGLRLFTGFIHSGEVLLDAAALMSVTASREMLAHALYESPSTLGVLGRRTSEGLTFIDSGSSLYTAAARVRESLLELSFRSQLLAGTVGRAHLGLVNLNVESTLLTIPSLLLVSYAGINSRTFTDLAAHIKSVGSVRLYNKSAVDISVAIEEDAVGVVEQIRYLLANYQREASFVGRLSEIRWLSAKLSTLLWLATTTTDIRELSAIHSKILHIKRQLDGLEN